MWLMGCLLSSWMPLEASNSDICACCHVGNCGSTREIVLPSRGRTDLGPEAESEAGLKWESEASLGPLLILDPELTNLATEPLTEVEQRMQERSPGVQSELVVMVALTVTVVSLISASLALFLCRKHKPTHSIDEMTIKAVIL
ncbi:zona pellucida sperm-binding protein 3-like isoform X1 [Rhincodon typus]|uniref:zona pellucida sperm-binding protein 3-like isoform X1 n=1 Tax=Rhincodon typus TaxID=259920 RepID=UPI002030C62D|nr:zona pellucida sperm-binding protein 3-like isoform X1 [Rhincodon typus]XP_048473826.1 zona pellucida sperm-binding protein 3-like isoform X1 [Rhincodon typus]